MTTANKEPKFYFFSTFNLKPQMTRSYSVKQNYLEYNPCIRLVLLFSAFLMLRPLHEVRDVLTPSHFTMAILLLL